MNKFAGTLAILLVGASSYAVVGFNADGNLSDKAIADVDTVVINNNATVTADLDETMAILRVNNQVSPTTGILDVSQNYTINATSFIQLGTQTGAGIITQSTGNVVSPIIIINNNSLGDLSRYDLSGGAVSASSRVDVNNQGKLAVSGGTLTTAALNVKSGGSVDLSGGSLASTSALNIDSGGSVNLKSGGSLSPLATATTVDGTLTVAGGALSSSFDGDSVSISGDGTLKMESGIIDLNGTQASDSITLNSALFEVSGGTVNLNGQVKVGDGTASEFKVVGDAATISLKNLNQQNATAESGTFNFVFDETGVSTIDVSGWLHLEAASIVVDGSAYTNGAATFTLFDAVNLVTLSSDISVTGFGIEGVDWVLTQDQTDGKDWVQLTVIPEPATLGLVAAFGGGILFIRRRFLI